MMEKNIEGEVLGVFYGGHPPPREGIHSSSNTMFVIFKSDKNDSFTGFNASYYAVDNSGKCFFSFSSLNWCHCLFLNVQLWCGVDKFVNCNLLCCTKDRCIRAMLYPSLKNSQKEKNKCFALALFFFLIFFILNKFEQYNTYKRLQCAHTLRCFSSFYNVKWTKSSTSRRKIQRFVAPGRSKMISLQDWTGIRYSCLCVPPIKESICFFLR